jgi:hypothetical protein
MKIIIKNENCRIVFKKNKQMELINQLKENSNLTWKNLSKKIGLCELTLRNALRYEKHLMSYNTFRKICKIGKIDYQDYFCFIDEIRDENWGRVKGGKIAGLKNKKGTPKVVINIPTISTKLTEFIGILLGDGSISKTNYSIEIILNSTDEIPYSNYISNLIYQLFKIKPKKILLRNKNALKLRVNSKNLFNFLVNLNIPIGMSKKKIPDWIFKNKKLLAATIRGLFDTDGSVYLSSRWCVLNFVSNSNMLRKQFKSCLKEFGIPTFISQNHINATSLWKIKKFMKEIGSSNLKHIIKFIEYLKNKKTKRSKDVKILFENYSLVNLPYYFKGE